MENFLTLLGPLAEAEAHEAGGFGLNFNILETNLVNLALALGILVYFGRGLITKILSDRRSAIETAISAAQQRQKEAAAALEKQKQQLAQAQAEAEKIRASAADAAKAAAAEILAKATQDVQRMQEAAAQDVSSEQERVMAELRQRVVAMSLNQAQQQLPNRLNDSAQQQLIDRSIAMLGGA
jgi:F-type H+-transporting ATPase subunit b